MVIRQGRTSCFQVRIAHPEQAEAIAARLTELKKLYVSLQKMAKQKIQIAEETQGQVDLHISSVLDGAKIIEITYLDLKVGLFILRENDHVVNST